MTSSSSSDLHVAPLSGALSGKTFDCIVSGSIGAVETVRFIRALRRLGASVRPWLTAGGAQFITPMALEWAAAHGCQQSFSGEASHIATGDACVVAPASANFLHKLANGITDTPTATLAASYLGAKRPVYVIPNMHESLFKSPAVAANIEKVTEWGVVFDARYEEGKRKFPEPSELADHLAHHFNATRERSALVTLGTTRGYVDDVRYLSNYSSGALGSLISEELYRHGIKTTSICGPALITPKAATNIVGVETNAEMLAAAKDISKQGVDAAVLAASVLDFEPTARESGKIRSERDQLTINCRPTEKIIETITPKKPLKVGFKLETDLSAIDIAKVAEDYIERYGLSMIVVNQLSQVSEVEHTATVITQSGQQHVHGKRALAQVVSDHIIQGMH